MNRVLAYHTQLNMSIQINRNFVMYTVYILLNCIMYTVYSIHSFLYIHDATTS